MNGKGCMVRLMGLKLPKFMNVSLRIKGRDALFAAFGIPTLLLTFTYLKTLVFLAMNDRLYSYVLIIPLVSGYLFYDQWRFTSAEVRYEPVWGFGLIGLGIALYLAGLQYGGQLGPNNLLSLMVFSTVLLWWGGFLFFYGEVAFRRTFLALFVLVFLVPIPTVVVDKAVPVLQKGSAEAAYGLFQTTGIPVLREGFTFRLPGLSINVAPACSGIRSAVALLVTSVLAGAMFLQRGWSRLVLVLAIIPITVLKNGLRIVTLSLLAIYVDESFITDSVLHQQGGIPFFIVALGMMAPVLWGLKKAERRWQRTGDSRQRAVDRGQEERTSGSSMKRFDV
jgi:exosortase